MDNSEHLLPLPPDQTVILVVDDEPMIVDLVRAALEGEGYLILTAADGEEGLLRSRSFPGTIRLLLTDVAMPKLSGLQLRDKLRDERPDTKVLLMSGHDGTGAQHEFLPKPFGLDALKERVRQLLLSSPRAMGAGRMPIE